MPLKDLKAPRDAFASDRSALGIQGVGGLAVDLVSNYEGKSIGIHLSPVL